MANELEFQPIDPAELPAALGSLPGWSFNGKSIEKEYAHGSFLEAIAFVNRAAVVAEQYNHHPDFEIHFKRVTLKLWTHKLNAVTRADLQVAAALEAI